VGGVRRGNGAKRNDLAERNPEPPNRRRSVYRLLDAVPPPMSKYSISLFFTFFFRKKSSSYMKKMALLEI